MLRRIFYSTIPTRERRGFRCHHGWCQEPYKLNVLMFIDSLSFIPMKLANFPKIFGLDELRKGYFPHLFNKKENENYVRPIPPSPFTILTEWLLMRKKGFWNGTATWKKIITFSISNRRFKLTIVRTLIFSVVVVLNWTSQIVLCRPKHRPVREMSRYCISLQFSVSKEFSKRKHHGNHPTTRLPSKR